MRVNIYRTCGHLDRKFIETKFFRTWESANNFCKFVAPRIYKDKSGTYNFTIIK